MGNFRQDDRGGFRGRSSGGRFGDRGGFGGGGFRDRDNRRERRPVEMHEATCGKCGKRCEVPFRPTGDKPVYCRDCFSQEGSNDNNRRNGNREEQSGNSSQLKEINAKLDKILAVLENLEMEIEEDDSEDEDSEEISKK